jgi:hypothetical protein
MQDGNLEKYNICHYQGLAFSDDELRDIKKQLIAWGFSGVRR